MQTTTIPIEEVTPIAPPFDNGVAYDWTLLIYGGIIVALVFGVWLSYRWYRGAYRIKGEDIRPELSNLDSTSNVLNRFLAVQGGMAILITFGILYSVQWILVLWPLTLASSLSFVGISTAFRSWMKDRVREKYKNRHNIEGYMRDMLGKKRRYAWSNCDIQTPYIMDDDMMRQIDENSSTLDLRDKNNKKIKYDVERLRTMDANPVDINFKYLVVVLTKGPIDIEWVEWWDIDMFGDYPIPIAGPELKHIATVHRVAADPLDPWFKRNEYIPVFVSVWDDRLSRQASEALPAIDVESSDIHIGLLKAAGVERKVTAGQANTDRAALLDSINSQLDFNDVVEATADAKAVKFVQDKDRIGNIDKVTGKMSPSMWVMAFLFIIGVLLGYTWGQNSILTELYNQGIAPYIPHIIFGLYAMGSRRWIG